MGLSLRNLRKKIVDVFDANTASDQQKRIAAGQPRYYQQQHPNAPVQAPFKRPQDSRNFFSKVADQFSVTDNGRTYSNPIPTNTGSTIHQLTHNGATNAVGGVIKPIVNPVNQAIEFGRLGTANATHNKVARGTSLIRVKQNVDNSIPGWIGGQVWHTGAALGDIVPNTVASFTGDKNLEQAAQNDQMQNLNKTVFGQILNVASRNAADYGARHQNPKLTKVQQKQIAAKNLEQAGIDPNASFGKQVTDTALGGIGLYGLVEGGLKTGKEANAFVKGKTPTEIPSQTTQQVTVNKQLPQPTEQSPQMQSKMVEGTQLNTPSAQSTPITLTERVKAAKDYVKQQDALQKEAAKSANKGVVGKTIAKVKAATVDSLAPLEDPVYKAIGYGSEKATMLRDQVNRSLTSSTIAKSFAEHNGLSDVIKSVGGKKDRAEFNQYLTAKHAQDLERNGINSGRNLAADANLIEAFKGKYEGQAQKLTQYNHALLDEATNSGLISPETNAYLKQKYPNYVPFDRIFSKDEIQNMQTGSGSGPASLSTHEIQKRLKGSDRQVAPPLESIIDRTNSIISQAERNKAANAVIKSHDMINNPTGMRELPANEPIGNKNTISFFDNGVKRVFETSPEIAKAAKNLNPVQQGMWGKVFSYPTRVLRLGATGANPAFAVANVVKDAATGFINSEHPLEAIGNPKIFLQALDSALHHGGKNFKELEAAGVTGTSFELGRNSAKLSVEKIASERNVGTKALYTVTHPSELLRAVEDTIGRSEEAGRAYQYFSNKEAAIKAGKGAEYAKIYAADAARNNTVNFARFGEYGHVVNTAVPYLNAGVQGARTLVRNLKERPAQTGAKIAIVGLMPTATVTAWNLNDPERKKAYDNISEYEKQNNIIIVPPHPKQDESGRWNVIKIPVSQEIANLNNIVRNGIEARANDAKYNFHELASNLIGTATSANTKSIREVANQVTPQIIKTPVELTANKNLFTGQQTVPDSMKNLAKKDQYNKNTSGTAKVIGRVTGTSPLQIDNAIRTNTGGLGQNLVFASDSLLAKFGVIKKSEVRGKSIGTAMANRFNSAQGQTEGAQYFKAIQDTSVKHKLAGNDYETLQKYLTKSVNGDGQQVPLNDKDVLNKNQDLASHPKVARTISDAAKTLSRNTGKPLDPLYKLSDKQQQAYYKMQGSSYNGQDYNRIKDENKGWMSQFQKDRAAYFAKLKLKPADDGRVKYPLNDKQQQALNNYFAVSDPAKRGELIKSDPTISKSLSALGKYGNDKRVAQGFAALDTYPETPPIVQKWSDEYFAQPKGTKTRWQRNNPEKWQAVSQDMASKEIYTLQKEASKSQFKDTGMSQAELKAAYNLGQYDIQKGKDSNGNTFYALGSSGGSGGGYGGGSGGGGGVSKNVNPYKYAVSLNAGKVRLKGKIKVPMAKASKSATKKYAVSKPRVTSKRSRV